MESDTEMSYDDIDGFVSLPSSSASRSRNPSGISTSSDSQLPFLGEVFTNKEAEDYLEDLKKLRSKKLNDHLAAIDFGALSSDKGDNILHIAAARGDASFVQKLIAHKRQFVLANIENETGNFPIHEACRTDQKEVVNVFIKCKADFINHRNSKKLTPFLVASYFCSTNTVNSMLKNYPDCINDIVPFDADSPFAGCSALHLLTKQLEVFINNRLKTAENSLPMMNGSIKRSKSVSIRTERERSYEITADEAFQEHKRKTEKLMIDILKNDPASETLLSQDRYVGNVMDHFVEIGFQEGVQKLLSRNENSPDVIEKLISTPNVNKDVPLITAIMKNTPDIALILLDYGADPNVTVQSRWKRGTSAIALSSLVPGHFTETNIKLIKTLLNKGADDIEGAMEIVPYSQNVQLLNLFYNRGDIESHSIASVIDKQTGDTILHCMVVDYDFRSSNDDEKVDDIVQFLERNVHNVMKRNTTTEYIQNGLLPIHVASKVSTMEESRYMKIYLKALKKFGVWRIFHKLEDAETKIDFLKEHLVPATFCVDHELVYELLRMVSASYFDNVQEVLDRIIHFKQPKTFPDFVYLKRALVWATEKGHSGIIQDLVKAEYDCHKPNRENGLFYFKHLPNNGYKQRAIDSYNELFSGTPGWKGAIFPAVFEVLFFAYGLFVVDIILDVGMVMTYWHLQEQNISFSNMNDAVNNHFSISYHNLDQITNNKSLDEVCYEGIEVSRNFETAGYFMAALIGVSLICLLLFTWMCTTSPRLLRDNVEEKLICWISKKTGMKRGSVESIVKVFMIHKPFIWIGVHFYRTLRAKSQPYVTEYKDKYLEGANTWNLVRRVEVGIESVPQILIQLWMISPLMGRMSHWSDKELGRCVWNGLGNIFSVSVLPATFIEKSLARLVVSAVIICLSVTFIRLTKKSVVHFKLFAFLAYFIAVALQVTMRLMFLRLLFVFYDSKTIIGTVLALHLLISFISISSLELPEKNCCKDFKSFLVNVVSVFCNACASVLIFISTDRNEISEDRDEPLLRNTFLSYSSHYLLILIEHIIAIICVHIYGYNDYGRCISQENLILYSWVPILLWIISVLILICYYLFLHHNSGLDYIGPRQKEDGIYRCHHIICFRLREVSCRAALNVTKCVCCVCRNAEQHRHSRSFDPEEIRTMIQDQGSEDTMMTDLNGRAIETQV